MNKQNEFDSGENKNSAPHVDESGYADISGEIGSKEQDQPEKHSVTYRPKKKRWKKVLFWILISFLILMLAIGITVFTLIEVGKSSLLNTESMKLDPGSGVSNTEVEQDGKTLTYSGKRYVYNENMTTILCIGVDRESFTEGETTQGLNGQADALFLYAMDTKTGKSTVIPIPRDTIVDVDLYSSAGKYVSSSKKQVCLSYAYGDGKHTSCENTVKSVSRLFYGLNINSYVAIDLKAIDVLSSKVGGVPVTPTESFSYANHYFTAGKETVLKGERARAFVQGRDETVLTSSLDRMSRQKQFVTSFFNKAIAKTKEDITFPITVFNSTSKYMITDINVAEISFFTSCVLSSGGSLEFASIDGEMKMGEKYAEYYADEQSVYETIINVFYLPA